MTNNFISDFEKCIDLGRNALEEHLFDEVKEKTNYCKKPFILICENNYSTVSCILGSFQLKCNIILISKERIHLIPYIKKNTGVNKIISSSFQNGRILLNIYDDRSFKQIENIPNWINTEGRILLLTSGTTNNPKIVMHTWGNFILQGKITQQELFPKEPSNFYIISSIAHAYAINSIFSILSSPYQNKCKIFFFNEEDIPSIFLLENYSKDAFGEKITTILLGTPVFYEKLSDVLILNNELTADKFIKIQIPFCGGSYLEPEIRNIIFSKTHWAIKQNYGSTETGNIAADYVSTTSNYSKRDVVITSIRCVGIKWPGVDIEIVKQEFMYLNEPEEQGELHVRTPWQGLGYIIDNMLHPLSHPIPLILRNNEKTFYSTGDLGNYDEVNQQVFVYRRKRSNIAIKYNQMDILIQACQLEDTIKNIIIENKAVIKDIMILGTDKQNELLFLIIKSNNVIDHLENILENHIREKVAILRDIKIRIHFIEQFKKSAAGKLVYNYQEFLK